MTIEKQEISSTNLSFPPLALVLPHQDLFCDDEELKTLFIKEKETCPKFNGFSVSLAREECVKRIVKINSHHGFSSLTAILAVNYLDRFLLGVNFGEDEKPWVTHLAAVACLSLAAKVEETHVPPILDLQVGSTKYVFESKTIQKMELLVLSSLEWRMNPVTPFSFIDHIIKRLEMKRCIIHWEFLRSCENLILLVISDSRLVEFVPSVLAVATMLHVVHQVEHCNDEIDYEKELLGELKINKEEVNDCYELISDIFSKNGSHDKNCPKKRKICPISSIPGGVTDAIFFSSDSSNDSWEVSSTPPEDDQQPIFKKLRVQEETMKMPLSLSRVFVDTLKSPH